MPVHDMVHLEHKHFRDTQHVDHLQAHCHTELVLCYSKNVLTWWSYTDMVELLLAELQGSMCYAESSLGAPTVQQALSVALPLVCANCGTNMQPQVWEHRRAVCL